MSMDFFWEQFGVECAEHLQQIERLLTQALEGPVGNDGISQLFRSMHSIKGLSKAMGLTGMESVAHRCEDILGLVRDKGVPLVADMVRLLQRANDMLSSLHETVTAQRSDAPADNALLLSLDNAYQRYSRDGASADPAPAPAPAPEAPPAAAAEPAEEEEPDPLEVLTKALETLAPEVATTVERIAVFFLDPDPAPLGKNAAKETRALGKRCAQVGLTALTEVLEGLAEEIARKIDATDGDRIVKLAWLGQELRQIEAAFGVDLGGSALTLRPPAQKDAMAQAVAGPLTDLDLSVSLIGLSDDEIADVVAKLWDGLRVLDRLLAFADPRNAQAALCDRLSAAAASSDVAVELADFVVALDGLRDRLFDRLVSLEDTSDAFDFRSDLASAAVADASGDPVAAASGFDVAAFLEEYGLNDEFVLCISHEYFEQLQAVRDGTLNALLVTIDLNYDAGSARDFLGWVRSKSLSSISRSVISGDETLFEFLLFTTEQPSDLVRDLDAAVGSNVIVESRPVTKGGEAVPAAASAAPDRRPESAGGDAPAAAGPVSPTPALTQLRVSAAALNAFMAQVGCLVSVRSRLSVMLQDDNLGRLLDGAGELGRRLNALGLREETGLIEELRNLLQDNRTRLQGIQGEFSRHLSLLQETALDLRVLPLSNLFARLPRIVRDLGALQGKDVRFVMTGGETVVDKSIIEALVDPLIHIVRNAVDHGIETPSDRIAAGKQPQAMLTLQAVQQGGEAKLSVIDDGRGINVERVGQKAVERGLTTPEKLAGMSPDQIIQFIFEPGFSTAAAVTETSGRGVGMDIVRTAVVSIGGKVTVSTTPGQGTVFDITLPISAAIQNTLVVRIGEHQIGIPSRYVDEVQQVERSDIRDLHDQRVHLLRGHVLPLHHLNAILMGGEGKLSDKVMYVVVSAGDRRIGLIVDAVVRREEMFLTKPHPIVRRSPYLFSATVSGDGKLILIVDVDGLMSRMAHSEM